MIRVFRKLAVVGTVLAFCVIVLGAFVRLSDAGLGCPDWPGCYGQITWPAAEHEVSAANASFPERPVETEKAWKEMVHRYLAGILGLLVFALTVIAIRNRHDPNQPLGLTGLLAALVIFQALLGMWTVTLLLKPAIVMAHLLGGMATFGLLWWLALRARTVRPRPLPQSTYRIKPWIALGLSLVVAQIALGGWTSSNYAALACPDFPTCMGEWWPETDFGEAFVLWREVGVDYEGGILDHPARVAIHLSHRIGAVLVLAYLGLLGLMMLRRPAMDLIGQALLAVLIVQITLGILNVVLHLPLLTAVAHTGGAAVLLMVLLYALHRTGPRSAL